MIDSLTEPMIAMRLRTNIIQVVDDNLFPHLVGLEPKKAGVLIPLTKILGQWCLLYTRRTDTVEAHKGQVSFPGGRFEIGDRDITETALREAHEEIGLEPSAVVILGSLPKRRTVSNYIVTPTVGVFSYPYQFKENKREVNRIFFVPLGWLANASNWSAFTYDETNNSIIKYSDYDNETIWGITAKITLDLIRTLQIGY